MAPFTIGDFEAEAENELKWRWEELALLKRQIADVSGESEQDVLRKVFVVFLYAHFEGACKIILSSYVRAVNERKLRVAEAQPALAAAAWAEILSSLRSNKKVDFFRETLPDDEALHRFGREREFAARIWDAATQVVEIESEKVIVTDSNLKPVVLERILYRLGMDPAKVAPYYPALHRLIGMRNRAAHGESGRPPSERDCKELEEAVLKVLEAVRDWGRESLRNRAYLRVPDASRWLVHPGHFEGGD